MLTYLTDVFTSEMLDCSYDHHVLFKTMSQKKALQYLSESFICLIDNQEVIDFLGNLGVNATRSRLSHKDLALNCSDQVILVTLNGLRLHWYSCFVYQQVVAQYFF